MLTLVGEMTFPKLIAQLFRAPVQCARLEYTRGQGKKQQRSTGFGGKPKAHRDSVLNPLHLQGREKGL